MFKRANKVTALLVAAASVMSIVPAMATTRIGTKDGHIRDGAIAFQDGKYLYDGYRANDDDNGIYYNDGTEEKEKFNEDLRDYKIQAKYGTKYAYAKDGNDQYLIDLSTGKIVDDETPEDKADAVKAKLRAALKKTDRYSSTGSWDTVNLGDQFGNTAISRNGYSLNVFGNQFGDVWYQYYAGGDKVATQTNVGQVARRANFTVKLPAVYTANDVVTLRAGIGGGAPLTASGANLAALQADARAKIAADIAANFSTIFDSTTVAISGGNIVGTAAQVGEIAIDNASLVQFATVYGGTLREAEVPTYETTSGALNLGTLTGATSSDATVAVGTTTSGAVTVIAVAAGTATITVKDSSSNVAKIAVKVTSDAGVKSIFATPIKYYSEAQKAVALEQLSNSGTLVNATAAALLQNFEVLGVNDLVSATRHIGSSGIPTLGVEDARTALINYIEHGTLGLAINDAATVRKVLEARLKTLVDAQVSADKTIIDRGATTQGSTIGTPGAYQGFVNDSGKYIDTSNLANVYVYSKQFRKTVKIKEFNKVNADYNIQVGLADLTALAQDKDYIYALAEVVVQEGTAPLEVQYFIQKISKAQGDTKDGAYLPKSVDSYQIDDETIFDNGDSHVAYRLIRNYADIVNGVATPTAGEDGFTTDAVRVKDGVLYVTGVKNDKVKVFKLALKKDKIDSLAKYNTNNIKEEKVDVYIAKKDGDCENDLKAGTSGTAVTYDVEGNTWVVNKGTITKFDGTTKKDVYTCDRTFTNIDVYDEKNLVVWDDAGDVYSNVGEGTKVTQSEATAVAPAIVTGWVQGTDGTWTFNDATGTKVVSKWQNIGGYWYYLKADGIMATGWYNDNGTWYYLNPSSGAMVTGWLKDPNSGLWYYLAGSGAMLSNTTVDGYQLGGSGAWIQ